MRIGWISNMHLDIPDCKRCCFCFPLRQGILIFGYLNLMFTVLILSLEIKIYYGKPITTQTIALYRGVGIFTQLWLPYLLYALEIIFNIILLVGAHTKQIRLIRVFYYYGLTTTLATSLAFILVYYKNQYHNLYLYQAIDLLEPCMAFCGFVLQAYLLLLIRTELQKLKYQQGQFSYVNHMSEVSEPPYNDDGRNPL